MKLKVSLASPPDRDDLVADVTAKNVLGCKYDRIQVLEINNESGVLTVELYPRPDGEPWVIEYEEFMSCLRIAKSRLIGTE